LGMLIDTTPVRKTHYNPETPGMTKIEAPIGLSFRPVKNVSIDASLLYVAGLGANNAECTYKDMITQQPVVFKADYKLHAFCPAIGVNLNF
ncbi:MAG: aromatic hydrocarbon degradation protein, partial [Muribaculaceae bacterium]|nr:aromatic hydrocarbon degradation protein [Muribaculaceae bacterium]